MQQDLSCLTVRITPEGERLHVSLNLTLLQSLEQMGVQWPTSCRVGTCRTCTAQMLSGQVRYEMAWPGLSAEEKADGLILPCVAFPVTNLVLKDPFSD
jgi:ferredoxin